MMPVGRAVVKTVTCVGRAWAQGPAHRTGSALQETTNQSHLVQVWLSGWASLPPSSSRPGSTAPSQRALLRADR